MKLGKAALLLSIAGIFALTSGPASAGPIPFSDLAPHALDLSSSTTTTSMVTNWGYGARENQFNSLIDNCVNHLWADSENPLPPLLFKSLMAVESSFNPSAVSATGAAGLTQLTVETARRFGLHMMERSDPQKALPAGLMALMEKHKVVSDPAHYSSLVGMSCDACPWSLKVAEAYEKFGRPRGDDRWALTFAAYNGGGGTVLRAMAHAYERGLDPTKWDLLAGPPGRSLNTPLHAACVEVYGLRNATRKAMEIAAYPRRILALYHQALAAADEMPIARP
jgi:hypothetical protein